ncbi:MAG: HAMP domain-containing histidine kinase [Clostridia bacterium]|nr:HAMP domain-containing histidine kinase [Clostridia bacterium]
MEKQLKQQRKRLFVRVCLILLAVCLAVSGAYCAICLNIEKSRVQNRELANLTYAKQILTASAGTSGISDRVYMTAASLIYFNNTTQRDWDSQIIITEEETGSVILNTAKKIVVKYGFKRRSDDSSTVYGFLDYNIVRRSLTDEQYSRISQLLKTERSDGKTYELVCTKFFYDRNDITPIIPIELQVVLVNDENDWFISDEVIETFELSNISQSGRRVECSEMYRNIVPKDFFLPDLYDKDYIRLLTDEQRKKPMETVSTGYFQYVFYASDYLIISESRYYTDSEKDPLEYAYIIQYAKKVDLLKNCRLSIIIGLGVIFGFFLIIAVILCLMIWTVIKEQIVQERKRADLTNALAHDIKTPLFVISGYAYSLKEDIDESEREEYLEKIIAQTENINSMVHKMLNLSKLNSYETQIKLTEFDLADLVKEITENYGVLPNGKSMVFVRSGDNTISADIELIRTAVGNLADNAVKYSPADSEIKISVNDKTLTISNKSEPISKSDLKRIWEPYERIDKSRHKKGNGLGLSIVKSIFDLHGIKYEMKMDGDTLTVKVN